MSIWSFIAGAIAYKLVTENREDIRAYVERQIREQLQAATGQAPASEEVRRLSGIVLSRRSSSPK